MLSMQIPRADKKGIGEHLKAGLTILKYSTSTVDLGKSMPSGQERCHSRNENLATPSDCARTAGSARAGSS